MNVFANIGLYALAKLGPAKIYNIEVLGTYSTDPDIQRSIQISGSLNISAYAGLRLRAEGGAGIELLAHDLRFGVGLNADVGVKAYADARPTIGYRDPGVFFFSGTLEMVAMPMLGLSGDFFIELDSPWFSPAPDKKWLWPLFSKEWPLSDPVGLNAEIKDYELGSGKVPEVKFKKPEFDPSKFMTNMVDNKLPSKSGGKAKGQSTFKEDGSAPKPVVAPKKPAPKQTGTKPSRKGSQPPLGKSAKPDPKAAKAEKSMKLLADVAKKTASLKAKAPFTKTDLTKELTKIKGQVRGVDFSVKPKDEMWAITPKAGGKTGRKFELGKKEEKDKDSALKGLRETEKKYTKNNKITKANAEKVASDAKKEFPVFKDITVIDGGKDWDFKYIFRSIEDGPEKLVESCDEPRGFPTFNTEEEARNHIQQNRGNFMRESGWESTTRAVGTGEQRRNFIDTERGRVKLTETWCDPTGENKSYSWQDVAFEDTQTHRSSRTPLQERERQERQRQRQAQERQRETHRDESAEREKTIADLEIQIAELAGKNDPQTIKKLRKLRRQLGRLRS